MKHLHTIVATALLALLLPAFQAAAAPQALAVIASNEPVPMQCADGSCNVILSAFCLQKDRKPPAHFTPYHPISGDGITVIAQTRAGETVRLPGDSLLSFTSHRGYNAVEAKLNLDQLAALDPVTLSVEVGARVTLAPDAEIDDPDPLTEDDLAMAAGPLRAAGEAIFEQPGKGTDAARLIGVAINLFADDDFSAQSASPEAWDRVATRATGMTAAGVATGQRHFRSCQNQVASSTGHSLRTCLVRRHDWLMRDINKVYWKAVEGGV